MFKTLYGYTLHTDGYPHEFTAIAWESGFFFLRNGLDDQTANKTARLILEKVSPQFVERVAQGEKITADDYLQASTLVSIWMSFENGPIYSNEFSVEKVIKIERKILALRKPARFVSLPNKKEAVKRGKESKSTENSKKVAKVIPKPIREAREFMLELHKSGDITLLDPNPFWSSGKIYFGPFDVNADFDAVEISLHFQAVICTIKETSQIEETFMNFPFAPLNLSYDLGPNPKLIFNRTLPLSPAPQKAELMRFLKESAQLTLLILLQMIESNNVRESNQEILKRFQIYKGGKYYEEFYLYEELLKKPK